MSGLDLIKGLIPIPQSPKLSRNGTEELVWIMRAEPQSKIS